MKEFKERLLQLLRETQEREGIIIAQVDIKAVQSSVNGGKYVFERHRVEIIIE